MIGRGPWTRETCSCSFFRKIVYKYPFLQRSIEKWKIEARLCVTLVDLLFYASFSPVCLCLATIGFHSASRFLSSRFLFFRICFFFFFVLFYNLIIVRMKQWNSFSQSMVFSLNRKQWKNGLVKTEFSCLSVHLGDILYLFYRFGNFYE